MYKTIQTFFKPTQNVMKGLLKIALFGVILSSSVLPTFALIPSNIRVSTGSALNVPVAQADVCAVAMGLGTHVSNATPNAGDTITYTLIGAPSVTAPTHVTVTNVLPAGLTYVSSQANEGTYDGSTGIWDLGTVTGPSVVSTTVTVKVNAGTEGQTISTTPSITYSYSGCVVTQAAAGATIKVQAAPIVTIPNADLAIAKTVDNATPHEGDTVHYTLNVTDLGPATSTAVTATDTLPSGLTFVSANASIGSYVSSTGSWTIGTMPNGSSATLTIAALVNAGTASTTIINTGIVGESASTTDPNLANNSSSVSITVQATPITPTSTIQNADIAIVKTADVSSTVEGATVHYTLTVTDLGPATSTGVVANDILPSGVTFVNATASAGTYVPSTGIWTIGSLSANSNATLTIAATVNVGTASTTISNTGTVTESASTTDPNLGNNSSTVLVAVAGNPGIGTCSIAAAFGESVSNATPSVGDTITYTIVGAPALTAPTQITVTELLPSLDLTFVSASTSQGSYTSSTGAWDLGTLNGSNVDTITIKAIVTPAAAGQTITTTPSVHFAQTNCVQTTAVSGATITVPAIATTTADIAIVKTADVSSTVEGATVHYTLTVTDLGPATSTNVVATDTLPSGVTFVSATSSKGTYVPSTGSWTIGDMAAGSTSTLTIAAKVNVGTASTTITNTGTVAESAINNDPNLANNSSSVSIAVAPNAVTPSADIAIVKTADVSSTNEGNTVHYTLTVTDLGPATSTGVVATDTLPSGVTFVNATASIGTYSTSTGAWTIGTLSANATATLMIAATVNSGTVNTTITNTGTVTESASTTDPNLSNNSSSVSIAVVPVTCSTGCGGGTPSADISIVKKVDATSTITGATINYTIIVTDLGPSTSTGVVATDTLPSGLSFVSATSSQGAYNFGTGVWTIGTLSANATATLTIAATVSGSAAGTTITNTAFVTESASTTDPNLANNSSSVSTIVAGGGGGGGTVADISIVKTVDNAYPTPGSTVHYTLNVANAGPSMSTIDTVQDALPIGLSFIAATSSTGTYNFGTGLWTIGNLAPNATATLVIAALVGSNTSGQTITNTATVSQLSSITDPNPGNNSSSVSVFVATSTPYADISVVKTVDHATAYERDTINYTIVVSANGPATSTGVVATDTLPSGVTFVNATASIGTYSTSTGAWTIGDMSASSTATLMIAATVNPGTAGTTIANTAIVGESASTTDQNPANNSSTATTFVTAPGGGGCSSNCGGGGGGGGGGTPTAEIAIAKSVDNANPAQGATVHYTLTVSATGPSASIGVIASDTLPTGVSFVSASTSFGSYNTATGVWTIGNMNQGQNAVLVITATVTAAPGTTITNTGTVRESPNVVDQNTSNNTASATLVVAGNGGGGGGGGGQVLGASTSTGQVLGASTCGLYLYDYIHPIRKNLNDPNEVKKLQLFLNQNVGSSLPITGYYGPMTIAAVDQFQVKYHTEVLLPWVPLGLPTEYTPTQYVYQTTKRWINLIKCPSLNIPMPTLVPDDFHTNYNY